MAESAFPSQSIFIFIQKLSNYSIMFSPFILPKLVFILRFLFFVMSFVTNLPPLTPSSMFCSRDSTWLHLPCLSFSCFSFVLSDGHRSPIYDNNHSSGLLPGVSDWAMRWMQRSARDTVFRCKGRTNINIYSICSTEKAILVHR